MSKFKVGERVAVYDGSSRYVGIIVQTQNECLKINTIPNCITAQSGSINYPMTVHPKQCRKLVRKYPRRIWINKREVDAIECHIETNVPVLSKLPDEYASNLIEFVEVRKK